MGRVWPLPMACAGVLLVLLGVVGPLLLSPLVSVSTGEPKVRSMFAADTALLRAARPAPADGTSARSSKGSHLKAFRPAWSSAFWRDELDEVRLCLLFCQPALRPREEQTEIAARKPKL